MSNHWEGLFKEMAARSHKGFDVIVDMEGVREYTQGRKVQLAKRFENGQVHCAIVAYNEGGFAQTQVDLIDVLAWLATNDPDLLPRIMESKGEQ